MGVLRRRRPLPRPSEPLEGDQEAADVELHEQLVEARRGLRPPPVGRGQAGVVGPFPEKAGTAASLAGFLMMLTAYQTCLDYSANVCAWLVSLTIPTFKQT